MPKLPVRDDFPSNSIASDKSEDEYPVVEPKRIVKGRILRKKKTLTSSFSEAFFGDQAENVVGYVLSEIVLPSIKTLISDMIGSSVDMFLFGENRTSSRGRKKGGNGSVISYGSFYQNISAAKNNRPGFRPGHRFDDIILEDRGEAQDVLDNLIDLLDTYDQVSIGDLNELVGLEGKHTDNKYGWTNLSKADVRRVNGGYLLDLPRPVELEL
jgi:hypothetical protein